MPLPGSGELGDFPAEQGLFVTLPAEQLNLAGFAQNGEADTMAPGALLSVIVNTVRESADWAFGYNATTLVFGDLAGDGVVDPVKVTRSAVVNAASIARMVLAVVNR